MKFRRNQNGITLVEVLASTAIMSLMIVGLVQMTNSSVEDTKSQQAALYQAQLTKALKSWLGNAANRANVAATATAAVPVKINLAQLAQWLPPNLGATNSYQQTPCIMAYYTAGIDRIDAVVTTEGGQVIDDAQLGYTVVHAGEGAGAIYARNPALAIGPYGTWQAPTATFTSAPAANRCSGTAATAGNLISLVSMDRNGTNAMGGAGEWLARNQITGRPDLNQMNTSINMNGSDVNNARDLNATRWVASNGGVLANNDIMTVNGNLYAPNGNMAARDGFVTGVTLPTGNIARLSQAVFYSHIISNGGVINRPAAGSCIAGTPQIYASAVSMATNPPTAFYGTAIVDTSVVGTQWRPTLYLYTGAGWVVGSPNHTRLNISVKCS